MHLFLFFLLRTQPLNKIKNNIKKMNSRFDINFFLKAKYLKKKIKLTVNEVLFYVNQYLKYMHIHFFRFLSLSFSLAFFLHL